MDISVFTTFSPLTVLLWILIISCAVQLWFYLVYFSRLTFYKNKNVNPNLEPASIVVCARNEAQNLIEYLPFVLEQDYPTFEVVVVNDCSYDNTEDILYEMAAKYSHLKIVTMKESQMRDHGKKIAMMMGIKGAKYENLVFTDADCKPKSNKWLHDMAQHFVSKTEIILGYGGYEKQPGLLNKIIRYDTFIIAMQYLSFALAQKTYMGVGRNLAYRKELFFKMKGFASHMHINSGDDDLFVNEARTKTNTVISVSTHTTSRVTRSFAVWAQQKARHLTTFKQYDAWSKYRLILISISQYLFFGSFLILLALQFQPQLVLSIFALRFGIQLLVFSRPFFMLDEKDLFFFFPFMEVILLVVYPTITLLKRFAYKKRLR